MSDKIDKSEHYKEGRSLGKTILDCRKQDIPFDARWDMAEKAKTSSRDEFEEFRRGMDDVFDEDEK